MILDASSVLSSSQPITVTAVSAGTYDIVGVGVGNPSPGIFGQTFGTATSQSMDIGGGGPLASAPQIDVVVGAAFTAGGAGTLRVQIQSAPDTNNTGTPGTWTTEAQTDDIALANLTAGSQIMRYTIPVRAPGATLPRFYRINYIVTTGPMTAGSVSAYMVTGIDNGAIYSGNY